MLNGFPPRRSALLFSAVILATARSNYICAQSLHIERLRTEYGVNPINTHATIRLPGATLAQVSEGGIGLTLAAGITSARQDGDAVVVDAGSGEYAFSYPMAAARR